MHSTRSYPNSHSTRIYTHTHVSYYRRRNSKQFSSLSFFSCFSTTTYVYVIVKKWRGDLDKMPTRCTNFTWKNLKPKFWMPIPHIQKLKFSFEGPTLPTHVWCCQKKCLRKKLLLTSQRFACMLSRYIHVVAFLSSFFSSNFIHLALLCFHARSRSVSYAFFSNIILKLFLSFRACLGAFLKGSFFIPPFVLFRTLLISFDTHIWRLEENDENKNRLTSVGGK